MTLDMSHPLLLDEPPTNGHLDAGDVPPLVIRQAARRVRWISLGDDEIYPGFEMKVWVNPSHVAKRMAEWGDQSGINFFRLVVLEHNGWADEDGTPYPPVSDPAFFDALPQEMGNLMGEAIKAAFNQVPNSTRAENRN